MHLNFHLLERSYIQIGTEEISYTGISTNTLTGVTREVRGTSKDSHSDGATVTNSTDYIAWGEAASGDYVIDPGLWTLDSFGKKLLALIHNGAIFEWDSDLSGCHRNKSNHC